MITAYPNKNITEKAKNAIKNNIKQVKEFIELEIDPSYIFLSKFIIT